MSLVASDISKNSTHDSDIETNCSDFLVSKPDEKTNESDISKLEEKTNESDISQSDEKTNETDILRPDEKTSDKTSDLKTLTCVSEISPEDLQIFMEQDPMNKKNILHQNSKKATYISNYKGEKVVILKLIRFNMNEYFLKPPFTFTSDLDLFAHPITYSKTHEFIMFPFYKNKSLDNYISDEKNNVGVDMCLKIAIETATALKEFHNACNKPINILSPRKIFIGDDNKTKMMYTTLSDTASNDKRNKQVFSSQKSSNTDKKLNASPPEAFELEAIFTTKTDVYSLGTVLFQLLTRKIPYSGVGHVALIKKFSRGERLECVPVIKDVPEDFIQLVYDCMNCDPEKRPSIDEIINRLKAMLQKLTE
jgi:hypothetical protein